MIYGEQVKYATLICKSIKPLYEEIKVGNLSQLKDTLRSFDLFEEEIEFDLLPLYSEGTAKFKKAFVKILIKLYEHTKCVLDDITSPNIDHKEFAKVLTMAMGELEHIPELKSCKRAIKLITNSSDLLTQNLPKYYRTSIVSNNNGANIFSDFFSDVLKSTTKTTTDGKPNEEPKQDKRLTLELARIMHFVKISTEKNVNSNSKKNGTTDKTLSVLMKALDSVYDGLKKKSNVSDEELKLPIDGSEAVVEPVVKTEETK